MPSDADLGDRRGARQPDLVVYRTPRSDSMTAASYQVPAVLHY